jgi:hypothetical protein
VNWQVFGLALAVIAAGIVVMALYVGIVWAITVALDRFQHRFGWSDLTLAIAAIVTLVVIVAAVLGSVA